MFDVVANSVTFVIGALEREGLSAHSNGTPTRTTVATTKTMIPMKRVYIKFGRAELSP